MDVPTRTFAKPKEALAFDYAAGNDGAVNVGTGRGRPSKAASDRIDFLVSKGWKIADYKVVTKPNSGNSENADTPVVEKATKVTDSGFGETPNQTRNPDTLDAFYVENGKDIPLGVGIKGVCQNHPMGYQASMTFCHCDIPKAFDNMGRHIVPIIFKPKRVKITK